MLCPIMRRKQPSVNVLLRSCATIAEATGTSEPIRPTLSPRKPKVPINKKMEDQNIHEAFQLIKDQSRAKFDETVDVAIRLNVDPRKQTQAVKGIASLPQGLGKKICVAVFATGADIEVAKKAGADYAGSDELIQMVLSGNIPFDRVVATPEMMAKLSKIGKVSLE
jgi:ribosomal protein L1